MQNTKNIFFVAHIHNKTPLNSRGVLLWLRNHGFEPGSGSIAKQNVLTAHSALNALTENG